MEVADKVAVITGGASGIGRSTALELARRGADIVVADINDDRIDEVRTEVESLGRRYLGVHCDVSKDADVDRLRDEALVTMGHVDIMMSNAGVAMLGPAEGLSMEEWDWILQINLFGVIRGARAFIPHMLERGSGYLVNTASVAGLYAYAWDHPTYITAKFGVVGFSEALALYLKPQGVGVSVLCPSLIATNMGDTARMGGGDMAKWLGEMPLEEAKDVSIVGPLVADAIRDEQYLILTDPDAILPRVKQRGANLDVWVDSYSKTLRQPPNLYR
ncbi:MAG: SDR family oxidoreductase [Actinobacteria bacterium]|nr:SDR family oxidoreductase [Actinomycetota bacterium]